MSVPLLQIDAFAERAFEGNPAAVCLLDEGGEPDEAWMQKVAQEMNLSETAFVAPLGEPGCYSIRWFTPAVEVALCGHATLASAHALWTVAGVERSTTLRFQSRRSGELRASCEDGLIELDFPGRSQSKSEPSEALIAALGAMPVYVGESEEGDLLAELYSAADVRGLQPDFAGLAPLAPRGVIVTAAGDGGYDFVSRFFAPAAGIDEDPVTGSAHCCLGPFWADRLGKSELRAFQASARGGEVRVRVVGDRVGLGGRAVTVATGRLEV